MNTCYVYDSNTGAEFEEHRIWAVSYEPYWQRILFNCRTVPMEELKQTIARIEVYTHNVDDPYELQCRLWRTFNYLNSVPINMPTSYGTNRIPRAETDTIIAYRRTLRDRIWGSGKPEYWDWHPVRLSLINLWKEDDGEEFLIKLYKKLILKRKRRATSKPELTYFLSLVEETSGV